MYRWGPHLFGLLNEPIKEDTKTEGPIVLTFSYRYKPGKELEVQRILSDIAQYYADMGEFGTLLQTFEYRPFDGGYSAIEIFTDARAFEIHVNNTFNYPDFGSLVDLEANTEVISQYIVGLPSEIAKAESIQTFYPDILVIEGKPLLKVYGQPGFGWYIPSRYTLDSRIASSYNVFYGLVPLLDLVAGIWNLSTWQGNQNWESTYYFETGMSVLMLISWMTVFESSNNPRFFNHMALVYVLVEIGNLFLVYNSE